ncbi:uncharacterized protein CCR75_005151 [Bremia lactucae]|uniref:Uncharacterized protein n=1 Tax=Bremia lactucae TaxID=4779 RepID=A0A976FPU8_BRELC|nr:hypothetical protein CCR75_005151 [Bremia lactucae]
MHASSEGKHLDGQFIGRFVLCVLEAVRMRDESSAGRLMRVLGDCKLFHIEAAIASISRNDLWIKSKSIDETSRGDGIDVSKQDAKINIDGRVLSLSDHKQIARLQFALNAVANAYNNQADADMDRNLVFMVAMTAITQSMRYCSKSRTNCFKWGPQAEKLHVLIYWMMSYESISGENRPSTCDYVRQLLLEWIQPTATKQNQLSACLTLFEMLRRHRSMLQSQSSRNEYWCVFGDRFSAYKDALRGIVEQGTTYTESHKLKLSKLALIALESIGFLCGEVALQHFNCFEAKRTKCFAKGEVMYKAVGCMGFFLLTLQKWHQYSIHRQFLHCAVKHLQSYVEICDIVLANGAGEDCGDGSIQGALNVLYWHWDLAVSLFCTRADSFCRGQKHQPYNVLSRILKKWTFDTFIVEKTDSQQNPEFVYAQMRYVCMLFDVIGGTGCTKAFQMISDEMKLQILYFYVRGLAIAVTNTNTATVRLCVHVLRAVLLPSEVLNRAISRDDEQGLLSQLLSIMSDSPTACGGLNIGLEFLTDLGVFIADFIISRGLFLSNLLRRLNDTHSSNVMSIVSLAQTLLHQLNITNIQTPLYRHWRKQLTSVVVRLIIHENHFICRMAISCLPFLDKRSCINGLATIFRNEANTHVTFFSLDYLLTTSTRDFREPKVPWLIDICQYGVKHERLPLCEAAVSPHDWKYFAFKQGESTQKNLVAEDYQVKVQDRLISLCISSTGYMQSANSSKKVLHVLLRKFFGSPRDVILLRILREIVASGWLASEEFELLTKSICSHVMNTPRLTEELLDDNLPSAAHAIGDLLFSRLAPLLVLRMFPRIFVADMCSEVVPCERKDLRHCNKLLHRHLHLNENGQEAVTTSELLFHLLAQSMVNPLEFKEVKMLATECLSSFPPPLVLPFVQAYLVAFLREIVGPESQDSSFIVQEDSIPSSCGLVTAKLMVYCLNRMFAEDTDVSKDFDSSARSIAILVQILAVPVEDEFLDLQRGCVDCMALIIFKFAADACKVGKLEASQANDFTLMLLLISWIFGPQNGEHVNIRSGGEVIGLKVHALLENIWNDARLDRLPHHARICYCNVLVRAICRAERRILARWKSQGLLLRIALAIQSCSDESIAAGGFQACDMLSMQHTSDLNFVEICCEAITARLELTRSESVAVNGLGVVGVLLEKLPGLLTALTPEKAQLIIRCLIQLRNRCLSPAVSEQAQSLLQAMTMQTATKTDYQDSIVKV